MLKDKAKALKIRGYSKWKKQDKEDAIRAIQEVEKTFSIQTYYKPVKKTISRKTVPKIIQKIHHNNTLHVKRMNDMYIDETTNLIFDPVGGYVIGKYVDSQKTPLDEDDITYCRENGLNVRIDDNVSIDTITNQVFNEEKKQIGIFVNDNVLLL
jgi:hypothetical protein